MFSLRLVLSAQARIAVTGYSCNFLEWFYFPAGERCVYMCTWDNNCWQCLGLGGPARYIRERAQINGVVPR